MKAKKILVTGGLGFLGTPLSKALIGQGHTVRILDNSSRGNQGRLGELRKDIELVQGDIRDFETVSQAVKGMDSICHLAFINGTEHFYQHPEEVLDVGVKGMTNLLDACREHPVKEFILASSSEVYQTPPSVPTDERAPLSIPDVFNPRYSYAGGKILSELMAIHSGKLFERILIFRPHNVFGPDMGWEHVIPQFVARLKKLKTSSNNDKPVPFPIQGNGLQTRSFIYIDDFTEGVMLVIDKGEHNNIYHIGSGEEISIRDLADQVAGCLGVKIRVMPGPEAAGATLRRCPDISKIRKLGFKPQVPFATALMKTVEWYREHASETKVSKV